MFATKPRAILIAGPTASGKSGLAIRLAEAVGGAIINADSMQVYSALRVLTARPSARDEARVPHWLYGHVDGGEGYSAGRYAREVRDALATVAGQNRVPIVCGGTGLYFKAMLEGLSPIPDIPAAVREKWRTHQAAAAPGALHEALAELDPIMAARLPPGDSQRITRALEVMEATGRSLAQWQGEAGEAALDDGPDVIKLRVEPEREALYRRIDRRFDDMMRHGALAEVEALSKLKLPADVPIMRALGVRPLRAYLAGHSDLATAVEHGKTQTRQFAKRQLTWLRKNMISWIELDQQQMKCSTEEIVSFIESKRLT
ncbi:MAG: tRNA (adenosine(37)-N6)-dimethylallyltransferase MiaA [Pseudomonadota bacterium]